MNYSLVYTYARKKGELRLEPSMVTTGKTSYPELGAKLLKKFSVDGWYWNDKYLYTYDFPDDKSSMLRMMEKAQEEVSKLIDKALCHHKMQEIWAGYTL